MILLNADRRLVGFRYAVTHAPTERVVQSSVADKFLNAADSEVAAILDIFYGQAYGAVCVTQLLRAPAQIPARLKLRKGPTEFAAIDPVASFIRAAAGGILDVAIRDGFLHDIGDFPDSKVFFCNSYVEGLIVNCVDRRFERADCGADDVFDVHDGPPGGSIALDVHLPGGVSAGDQIIQNDIETQPRRNAISRGIPHERRAETIIRHLGKVSLNKHFRFCVGSYGAESRRLVVEEIARRAIRAARGRKNKPARTCRLRRFGQLDRSEMIYVVGDPRVQVAERIVGERCKMENTIKAREIFRRDVAQVFSHLGYFCRRFAEVAARKQVRVQADYFVSRSLQHRSRNGADIAFMPRKQYLHWNESPTIDR
jgi:hypothetical protein